MVFSSHVFLLYFLPTALALYYVSPPRLRHLALTLLSYAFYGWANPLFVVLLLTSTVIDYFCGLAIADSGPVWLARLAGRRALATRWRRPLAVVDPENATRRRRRRTAVAVSVVTNLSLLGFFKYFNFGVDAVNGLAEWTQAPWLRLDVALRVTLPLGISFYTFQSMSYTIDVARGHAPALRRFIDFACYVSMFPQLVAGPIIRFSEVAGQLASRTHTVTKFARGIAFISLGLAKKVLLANPCGRVADLAFDAGSIAAVDAWYGVTAYAFQIYFDFSGYSDMAIGLGLMLGFVFPEELRFALPCPVDHRVLAALAHLTLVLAAGLSLHPAGWQPRAGRPDIREPRRRDAARRVVARRRLDLRHLGRSARVSARVRASRRQGPDLPGVAGSAPDRRNLRDRARHLGVLPSGRPDRGHGVSRQHAGTRAGDRCGAAPEPGPLRPVFGGRRRHRRPCHLDRAPDVGLDTAAHRGEGGRGRGVGGLAWAVLATQAHNPFIYFIF